MNRLYILALTLLLSGYTPYTYRDLQTESVSINGVKCKLTTDKNDKYFGQLKC